ncbi:MAG: hypothetical protein BJ554DRAFT_7721, partial [Olpidium bornovanus]
TLHGHAGANLRRARRTRFRASTATTQKLIQEFLPSDITCPKETRDLIHIVAALNVSFPDSLPITAPSAIAYHFGLRLGPYAQALDFDSYVDEVSALNEEHKLAEGSGMTQEQLLELQEALTAKAREQMKRTMPAPPSASKPQFTNWHVQYSSVMLVRLSLLAAVSAAFLAPSCAAARGSLQDGIFVSPNNLDSPPPTLDGSPYNLTWTNVQDPSTAAVRSVNMQLGTGTAKDVRIVNTSIGKVPWPAATSFAYTFPADLDPAAQYTVVWQALGLDETTVLGTAYVTWFKVLAAPGVLPTAANPTSGVPAANLTSGAPAAAPASGGPTAAPASAAPNVGAAAGNGTAGAESATPPA